MDSRPKTAICKHITPRTLTVLLVLSQMAAVSQFCLPVESAPKQAAAGKKPRALEIVPVDEPPPQKRKNVVAAIGQPHKVTLVGEINQLLVLCQAAGINLSEPKLPATVTKMRLGSTGIYAGIREGDRIVSGKVDNNVLTLQVERNGQKFLTSMATDSKAFTATIAAPPLRGQKPKPAPLPLGGNTSLSKLTVEQAEQLLSQYDFTLVVDHSGSMLEPSGDSGSKMQWVQGAISDFCDFLDKHGGARANLVTFNAKHETFNSISSSQVMREVSCLDAEGGTNLGDPLQEAIDMTKNKGKRQMIIVMTDGMPNLGPSVEQTIINTANSMRQNGDMVISILEVGKDTAGGREIARLDNLTAEGARYDIVDAKFFDELLQYGLKRCLADALLKAQSR